MTDAMKTSEIKRLNKEVAALLGVEEKHFPIDLKMRSYRTHGQVVTSRRTGKIIKFRISSSLKNDNDIIEVILHELCHVYNDKGKGHDFWWKQIADKVGKHYHAKIQRCDDREHTGSPREKHAVAVITCPHCGKKSYLYKRTKYWTALCIGEAHYNCGNCRHKMEFKAL